MKGSLMLRFRHFGKISWRMSYVIGLCALVCLPLRSADTDFRKTVGYRTGDGDASGEIRWNSAMRQLSLHDASGKEMTWPPSLTIVDPKPRLPIPTPIERPDEVVAVFGYRERLRGRIRSLNDRENLIWSIGDSSENVSVDPASAFAWSTNPGKWTLLFRSFESPEDPSTFVPREQAADGTRMLRLSGTRRETPYRYGERISDRALIQIAFEENAIADENGPLTLATYAGSAEEPFVSVTLRTAGDNWELSSPQDERTLVAKIPRRPGMHRLSMFFGEDRVRFCVDEAVALTMRTPASAGPLASVSIGAEKERPRVVDALIATVFGPPAHLLQWPVEDDLLKIAEGHEWLGTLRSLSGGQWRFLENERQLSIPLGLTSTWIPPVRRSGGQWALGPVIEVTFYGATESLWRTEADDGYFASLGLLMPPGKSQDRVEGAVENCDASGITLRLSQGGKVVIPFESVVAIERRNAVGLRVIDSCPHHLGDEVDLRVIPPEPLGNRLELAFQAKEEEAGWPLELAIDAVEVLGPNSPKFGDLIRKGELLTELRLNGNMLGTLNEKVALSNETPERLRFAIPAGVVKPGTNRIEFRLKGRSNDPNYLDDLGILGVRLYRTHP
ncbi:hypothetical protein GC170_14360 [bacterium]|nr:hypothetical protein [bacterium]